jgi:hypothetical protein
MENFEVKQGVKLFSVCLSTTQTSFKSVQLMRERNKLTIALPNP